MSSGSTRGSTSASSSSPSSGQASPVAAHGSPRGGSVDNDDDVPLTAQGWFFPSVVTASIVGAVALLAGTGVALVGFGVIADPRQAAGAQVNVTVPAAAAP